MTFEQVARQAYDFGYHRKAEWYRRGYFANFGEAPREFFFVTVRSSKPYRVWCWRVDPQGELVAQIEIDAAIEDLKRREQSQCWELDESRGVIYAELPHWKITAKVKAEIEQRQYGGQAA
jgi:hypothetical protein